MRLKGARETDHVSAGCTELTTVAKPAMTRSIRTMVVAASAAYVTPVASPVNTLVLGPGGYRFADFVRVGLPLLVLNMVLVLIVVPLVFPF